jgi:hypothetical protein
LEDSPDIFEKKLESTFSSLLKNYEKLTNQLNTNKDPLLKGWAIFYLSYFTKIIASRKEIKTLKKIQELYPNLSLEINETINPFDTFLPVYEFCTMELNKIKEKMRIEYDKQDIYESIDYKILEKEIKHLEIRVKNTYFELYINKIRNRNETEGQLSNEMDKKIEMELKSTIEDAGVIGNEIGQAISENLLSYFYFYNEDIKKSFQHSLNSYYLNEKIKNFKGMELAFNDEKIQKFLVSTPILNNKMQETLHSIQFELSQIKEDNSN